MICGGKLFQSLIVLRQKLYLYSSHDVCTGINVIGSEFLVFITVLCFACGILIAAWPCSVLYIKVSLFTFLLCSNIGQLQGRNIVYGLRAQSPKYDWDQGSEERAQGSEEWDQGSQGF